MSEFKAGQFYRGWDTLARYLKCTRSTAIKWNKKNPMPIRRTSGNGVLFRIEDFNSWLVPGQTAR